MAAALKCPNPSCSFLFDPTQVPAGVVLTCPRCSMKFTLGPPPGSQAPPTGYDATPPSGLEFGPATATPHVSPTTRRVAAPRKPGGHSSGVWLVLGLVLLAPVLGVILWKMFDSPPASGGGKESPELNFAFDPPPDPWKPTAELTAARDDNLHLAHQLEGPDGWAVIAVKNHDARNPRPTELKEAAQTRLKAQLDALQAEDIENAKWGAAPGSQEPLPAGAFAFRGIDRKSQQTVAGECYTFGFKGIGYTFIGWAGEKDTPGLLPEFKAIRDRFRLLDPRADWKEKVSAAHQFRGDRAGYRLSDVEGLWREVKTRKAEEEDPNGDILLQAEIKSRQKVDLPPKASLITYLIPAGGDPLDAARAYVQGKYDKDRELFGETKLEPVAGDPAGDPPPPSDEPIDAPVARFRTRNERTDKSELVVLSAVKVGDKIAVVDARCDWTKRSMWERRLMQLAGSLKP
jgi:hypothetical protein